MDKLYCEGGGCSAKLGPKMLSKVMGKLERKTSKNLLVGYESSDDAAVYQMNEEQAIVQTLDFFPPMVEDPYVFGQIAAANALSDIYAMGAKPLTALNIVCFPEKMDLNILGKIMEGGNQKVMEAGAILVGGHSIHDSQIKYGLSITGVVHPQKILRNNMPLPGDVLLLTKPLGVGLVTSAHKVGRASKKALDDAICSMTTLNKYAMEVLEKYDIHACTDVTGFGLLGHLAEMCQDKVGAMIDSLRLPLIYEAKTYAKEFMLTSAAQRNREFLGDRVSFLQVPFAIEEILFDPQTSGGLLVALEPKEAKKVLEEMKDKQIDGYLIGEIKEGYQIQVR